MTIRPFDEPTAQGSMHYPAIAALATSSFVFVTAETLPVGLLPQIAHGMSVSEATVGLLLTSYAGAAAVTAIPLTALTMRIARHRLIAVLVAIFAVSQAAAAIAPSFLVLVLARLICAFAHGVFWSSLAPAAARLAPVGQAGRVTSLVFVGNSAALVLGVPLGTALGQVAGWRIAVGALAAAGALSTVALVKVLPLIPAMPSDLGASATTRIRTATRAIFSRALTPVCAVTTVLVIGHFAAYTYIAPLVRRTGGLDGFALSALLLGYGIAGLIGNLSVGRIVDRRLGAVLLGSILTIAASLAVLGFVNGSVPTVLAVLAWGLGFSAIPVSLQAAVLKVAPATQDAASAVYVVAFQIGIGAGAFVGEQFVEGGRLGDLPLLATTIALISMMIVLAAHRTFPLSGRRAQVNAVPATREAVPC